LRGVFYLVIVLPDCFYRRGVVLYCGILSVALFRNILTYCF